MLHLPSFVIARVSQARTGLGVLWHWPCCFDPRRVGGRCMACASRSCAPPLQTIGEVERHMQGTQTHTVLGLAIAQSWRGEAASASWWWTDIEFSFPGRPQHPNVDFCGFASGTTLTQHVQGLCYVRSCATILQGIVDARRHP